MIVAVSWAVQFTVAVVVFNPEPLVAVWTDVYVESACVVVVHRAPDIHDVIMPGVEISTSSKP